MILVNYLILLILVLVSMGFITLMECKALGSIQIRKGPNSVGFMGLIQPFSDGIKLFFKEQAYPCLSNFVIYYLFPVFMLILSFSLWLLFPYIINIYNFHFWFLFFMYCTGMSVYGIMLSGWSSNSKYSLLGCMHSIAQTISYEVSMALIMICFMIFI